MLLIISLTALALGLGVTIGATKPAPAWLLALPLGAVFLGLFLTALMLQNEVAKFDEEERAKLTLAARLSPDPHRPAKTGERGVSRPSLGSWPAGSRH